MLSIRRSGDVPPYTHWKSKAEYSPSLNHVCDYVRLLNHLGKIVEGLGVSSPPRANAEQGEDFTPHLATYLKLLLAASYARTFLRYGRGAADKLYYLDILSASGLTYPRGEDQPLPGSCFWVPLARQEFAKPGMAPEIEFDRMWAFDRSTENLKVLAQRHQLLCANAGFRMPALSVVHGDINQTMPVLLDELSKEREVDKRAGTRPSLSLAFIDNIGLDVHMSTIQKLQSSIRADLVVHLPMRAIWRSIQQHKKTDTESHRLTLFFGDEGSWQGIADESQIPRAYQACVQGATGADFQEFDPVIIRSENQEFALCIYARRTRGISGDQKGWVATIQKLAEACNQFNPDMLKSVLAVASGRQATLGS